MCGIPQRNPIPRLDYSVAIVSSALDLGAGSEVYERVNSGEVGPITGLEGYASANNVILFEYFTLNHTRLDTKAPAKIFINKEFVGTVAKDSDTHQIYYKPKAFPVDSFIIEIQTTNYVQNNLAKVIYNLYTAVLPSQDDPYVKPND